MIFKLRYSEDKIKENIQCEIMEVSSEEVKESYREEIILEMESNLPEQMELNIDRTIEVVIKLLESENEFRHWFIKLTF